MRLVIALFLFSILHSCMPNVSLTASAAADTNVSNLSRLHVGMNQKDVLRIMRHPYSDQTFEMDNATYDVWFYITDIAVLGQSRMVETNLTPLTFKNGELIGWGYAYYNYLKTRKIEAEQAKISKPRAPQKIKEPPAENIELEKTLKMPVPRKPSQQMPSRGQAQPTQGGPQSQQPAGGGHPQPTPQSQPKTGITPVKPPAEQPENLSPLEPQRPQSSQPQPVHSGGGQAQPTPGGPQGQQPAGGGHPQPTPHSQPKAGITPAKPPVEPQSLQQSANGTSFLEPYPSSFSMSSKQKSQNGGNAAGTDKNGSKKEPMSEEDEEILHDASQQQFDQT